MAETVETLQYELTANLGPLFAALEQGLKGVKDRLNAFRGEGKVDLTASVDKMLSTLSDAKGKAASWKRETDSVSVVQPSVSTGGFFAGLDSLRQKAEGVARTLGNVFFAAAGFREITAIFSGWVKASGDQEVALARLRAALGASGAAGLAAFEPLKAQAEDLAKRYGQFGDEAIESGQAVLATFKLTEGQISALTPVLLDAATGLTKLGEGEVSLEQVAVLVGKALNGHAEALQRLGIQVDAARYKIDPLGAVVDALNHRFQGLTAAVAATDQGKLKSLAERWGEIKETLGDLVKSVLVPVGEALKPMLNLFLALPQPIQEAAVVIGVAALAMRGMGLTLADVLLRLLAFVETLAVDGTAAATRFTAAIVSMNWAGLTSGIRASASALVGLVNGLNLASKGILLVAAAWAGWQIGRWISDVTGLSAATSTAAKMDAQWTEAELERFAAQLQAKTGIEMNAEAMRVWVRLSAETRQALIEEATATGDMTITVQDLTAAMQAQLAAQREIAQQTLWADESRQLTEFVAYYRMSRAEQIATDIAAAEMRISEAQKGGDEEKKLQQDLTALLRQAAQEKVRLEQDAARKGADATAQAHEQQKGAFLALMKTYADGLKASTERWAAFSRQIAGDMLKAMDPAEYERSQIRLQAADMERDARATQSGQALADALVRIEQWKAQQIGAINDQARQDEAEKQQRSLQEEQQRVERSTQEAMQRLRQQVQATLDPMGEMVRRAYQTMSASAALWAERVAAMMQPLQQAIYSMLMGMKVRWGDVLRQMLATFIMQFVNKFLAWVATMIVSWITGESTKTAASSAGAAAQVASAKTVQSANASIAASSMSAAIAEIFEAHAWIPYVGVAIAAAFSAEALAIWGALSAAATTISMAGSAMATGGLVDRPTWTLSGEAGPELFAPVSDFRDVVGGLLSDTISTARLAAIGVGVAARGGDGGGGGSNTWEPHFHGLAFVDTGNRAFLRASARKFAAALAYESKQRLGG